VIENIKEKKVDPKVQAYLEQVKMLKKDMNINKDKEDDGIEIIDIISSICARHYNCNFKDIAQLTIYQVVNMFKRLHKLDEYFMNLNALVQHGNSAGVELKHYTSKLT
jgi:RNA processing factor Prp31